MRFNNFAESSLDILVIFNLLVADYASELMAREAILLQVMDLLKEAGAEFAFPTRTLYLDSIQSQSSPKSDQDFLGVADRVLTAHRVPVRLQIYDGCRGDLADTISASGSSPGTNKGESSAPSYAECPVPGSPDRPSCGGLGSISAEGPQTAAPASARRGSKSRPAARGQTHAWSRISVIWRPSPKADCPKSTQARTRFAGERLG